MTKLRLREIQKFFARLIRKLLLSTICLPKKATVDFLSETITQKKALLKNVSYPWPFRTLVIGQLSYGSTSWSRAKALGKLMQPMDLIDVMPYIKTRRLWGHFLVNHLYVGHSIEKINSSIMRTMDQFKPEIMWVDKGLHLWPNTLQKLKRDSGPLLIHFSPDNQKFQGNQSRHYLRSVPIYDVHITTKRDNIAWLYTLGARQVEYMGKGFDPDIHRPIELSQEEMKRYGCDIGFVGHWEPSREDLILFLYERGYKIRVWGGGWERARHKHHPLFADAPHLVGDDYAKAVCGAKINLCLLSQWFGDRTTARSVEIPACGRFMLAERNEEHLSLFKEGVEAEFYDTREEMLDKINYYLSHEEARENIARAGRQRCMAEYTNEVLLKDVLKRILAA